MEEDDICLEGCEQFREHFLFKFSRLYCHVIEHFCERILSIRLQQKREGYFIVFGKLPCPFFFYTEDILNIFEYTL